MLEHLAAHDVVEAALVGDPLEWAEHEPHETSRRVEHEPDESSRWVEHELADHELAKATPAWDAEPGEDHDDQYWRDNEAQFATAC